MEVWVVLEGLSWFDADYHTEWGIYGIYSSEEKATKVKEALEKENENEDDFGGCRVEKHCIQ